MNTYDYTYGGAKKKLTLSVNGALVNAAKAKRMNLSSFLEAKLFELLNSESNQCGGQDSNPRTPAGADLESATFVHSVTPASYSILPYSNSAKQ
jgi:hypothetical protein